MYQIRNSYDGETGALLVDKSELGKRLKVVRKSLHMRQLDAVENVDVQRENVSKWERGNIPDTGNAFERVLREGLGVSRDDLENEAFWRGWNLAVRAMRAHLKLMESATRPPPERGDREQV